MFTRTKLGTPVDDLGQTGDPWLTGNLHDRPNPQERQHWAERYDEGIARKLAEAGVDPGSPHYDYLYTEAINGDMTHSAEGLTHGHELPMRKREAILYAPETEFRHQAAQADYADQLMAEYARRVPELAQDIEGLSHAVEVTLETYADRDESPRANPGRFLRDVEYNHRAGARRYYPDYGADRTAGISTSGAPASGWDAKPDQHPDNDGGMVGEIRALQRARGW